MTYFTKLNNYLQTQIKYVDKLFILLFKLLKHAKLFYWSIILNQKLSFQVHTSFSISFN